VQQVVEAGTRLGRNEQDGHQAPLAQRLLEGRMQLARRRVLAVLQVASQQVLVFLDQLIDQLAVGVGDRVEVGVANFMLQNLDHVSPIVRRQVEHFALVAEAFAEPHHQAGQIDVVGIDLVDDDHARQATRLGGAHHALGHQFDAGLGIDHYHGGIDRRQRGKGLTGEIGITRRVEQVDMHAFGGEIHQCRIEGMTRRLFLRIEIAHCAALFHRALGGDRAGPEQKSFR
jgi:hypothetical protein